MLVRVAFVTIYQKCQRHVRSTLNYIKNISRECVLRSLCVLLVPTHPNLRHRVCNITKPFNLRDRVTVSIPHLMALRLMSPRGAPCQHDTIHSPVDKELKTLNERSSLGAKMLSAAVADRVTKTAWCLRCRWDVYWALLYSAVAILKDRLKAPTRAGAKAAHPSPSRGISPMSLWFCCGIINYEQFGMIKAFGDLIPSY